MKRVAAVLCVVSLVAFLAVSPFAGRVLFAQAKSTLKVGAVLPLSGPMGPYGKEIIDGMDVALEKIKETDADLASRIEIVRLDAKALATEAAEIAIKNFEERKIDLVFGALTSTASLAIIKAVNPSGKLVVTPASTNTSLTKGGNYVFRTCYVDAYQGNVLARFAANEMKKTKAGILYEETSEPSKAIAKEFQKTFTAKGGTIVAEQSYKTGTTDFKKILEDLRKKGPQVLLVPGYYQEVARIMDQANKMGFHISFLGGDGWESPNLYKLAGKDAVKGHYYVTHFTPDIPEKSAQDFVSAFQKTHKRKPTMLAAMGYDGMMVVADAFKRAKSPLTSSMISSLSTTRGVQGVLGEIRMSKDRNAEKPAIIMQTTVDGNRFKAKVDIEPKV